VLVNLVGSSLQFKLKKPCDMALYDINYLVNMSVYDFDDYKMFFNDWVQSQPREGHGEYRRLALSLGISTTLVSQVFRGGNDQGKDLSLEMTAELCDYLSLNDDESEYLLLLVEFAKAGSTKLKKKFQRQIRQRQDKARKIENRVKKDIEMDETTKSIFYSSWIYSGIRILTDTELGNDAAEIAKRLHLPRNQVQKVIEFLLEHKLCLMKEGKLKMGPARTHIGSSNLLVVKHHQNWRLQAFQKMIQTDDDNLFYTSPMSLSFEVAEKIRRELPSFIEKISASVGPSKSETVRCLNIDWFEY
jgi:uncharacterized protein (TIGR02147 family)